MNFGDVKFFLRRRFPTIWIRLSRLASKGPDEESAKDTFTSYYETNFWNAESRSGGGSTTAQTDRVRQIIEKVVSQYRVERLVDIPCGDYFWMRNVDLGKIQYVGFDLVEEMVATNQRAFGSAQVSFQVGDLMADPLPDCDLILCRDALVHFSYDGIWSSLTTIAASSAEYLLTTTFPATKENWDIKTGQWRPLNLFIAPFNLLSPIEVFGEESTEQSGAYRDKALALIRVADLRERLLRKHE